MAVQFKATDRLMDVIAKDYRMLQVMSRFSISLGFGEKTIGEVCKQCGVDCPTFLAVINYIKDGAEDCPQDIENISVPSLVSYLKQTHVYFLDFLLPSIRRELLNSIDCSMQNEIAFLVLKFYDEYYEEVRKHLDYEDSTVFAYVAKLLEGELPKADDIHLVSRHHDSMEDKLGDLKNLFLQYYPQKENNNELNAVLLDIYRCEEDLAIHCRVEDNIFEPAVRKLEHDNRLKNPEHEQGGDETGAVAEPENQLSQREKEIVICVAKGMQNKEIADKLCLSVNTVTTHRRNIARKLQIHSSAGITIYAIVNKLVTLQEVHV